MTWKYHFLALSTYKGYYDVRNADGNIHAHIIFTYKTKLQLRFTVERLRYNSFNEKRV